VGILLPTPELSAQVTEVILDNDDPGTSFTGSWSLFSFTGQWGDDFRLGRVSDTNEAVYTFAPTLPSEGHYEVYLWWVASESLAEEITVRVEHSEGTDTLTINQRATGDDWDLLGSYNFTDLATVQIVASKEDRTMADAVRLVKVSSTVPLASIVSISPNPAHAGGTIDFDGSATAPGGEIAAYLWESSLDGPIASSEDFSFSTLSEGLHTITFSAQNGAGDWSKEASAQLQVDPPNQLPLSTIDNVSPNPATLGQSITFEGTSSDPDGEVVAHLWLSSLDGTIAQTEDFSTSSLTLGTHVITYTVEDDDDATSLAGLDVIDVVAANQPPISAILSMAPNPAVAGELVFFDGSASDPDGEVVAHLWNSDLDGDFASVADPSSATLTTGTHTISYSVQDNLGAWSTPATAGLSVEAVNAPPLASIVSITPAPATAGATVAFDGTATDSDGDVVAWLWESDLNGPIGSTEDIEVSILAIGTHAISFSAQDNLGAWSQIAMATLNVQTPNQPPTALLDSILPAVAHEGESVAFNGTASDVDGEVIEFLWTSSISGLLATTEDFSTATLPIGDHIISFSCKDNQESWSEVVQGAVSIGPPNLPPTSTIDSITPTTALEGTTIAFLGTASDIDGDVIEYAWESSLNGPISTTEDFSTASLSVGTHDIYFTVKDDDEALSTPAVTVLVIEAPNQPPISFVDSISPNPAQIGDTISFLGHGTDSDGEIIGHRWRSNLDGRISDFEDFSTATLSVGTHIISYKVLDDDDVWSSHVHIELQVDPMPNVTPVATITRITPNPTVSETEVTFDGTAVDSDGEVISYLWESTLDGILSNLEDFSTVALTEGTHTISFTVQDDNQKWSDPVSAVVQINPKPNELPTATILDVAPNPAELGESVTFNGSGSDPDGEVAAYEWASDQDGALSSLASFSTSALTLGGHNISFRLQDNDGEWSPLRLRTLEIRPVSDVSIELVSPADGAEVEAFSSLLQVQINDPQGELIDLKFHGHKTGTEEEFTIVALPDTQKYSQKSAWTPIFEAQTQWIVDNKEAENIIFVSHVGDVVQNADSPVEWDRADEAMSVLDDVVPFAIAPGNHDQDLHLNLPEGVSGTLYDSYFPRSRFEQFPWYADSYPPGTNWNSYQLFSASSLDFILVHLQFCPSDEEVAWAAAVLANHPDRKAILTTHGLLDQFGNRSANLCEDTEYIWSDLVVPSDNVFLVLCGHMHGQTRRTDTVGNREVPQLLANFQRDGNGGNGYLRILRFIPGADTVEVRTYSPWLDNFLTGPESQFTMDFPLRSFLELQAMSGVPSGSSVSSLWPGLQEGTEYEWFVTATEPNGAQFKGPIWSFTTPLAPPTVSIVSVAPSPSVEGAQVLFDGLATDLGGEVVEYLWESDMDGPLATTANFGSSILSVGSHTISFHARDDDNLWSEPATTTLTIEPLIPTGSLGQFRRGDANRDNTVDLSDGIFILNFLFSDGNDPQCLDAADVNDTGDVDISDPIAAFNFLFLGGDSPPLPGAFECGADPTPDIGPELLCATTIECE